LGGEVHGTAQVGRAHEYRINSGDGHDGLDLLDGLQGFDLAMSKISVGRFGVLDKIPEVVARPDRTQAPAAQGG